MASQTVDAADIFLPGKEVKVSEIHKSNFLKLLGKTEIIRQICTTYHVKEKKQMKKINDTYCSYRQWYALACRPWQWTGTFTAVPVWPPFIPTIIRMIRLRIPTAMINSLNCSGICRATAALAPMLKPITSKASLSLAVAMTAETGMSSRRIYGTWNFGAGRLKVGKDYTPVSQFVSAQAFDDDPGLIGYWHALWRPSRSNRASLRRV